MGTCEGVIDREGCAEGSIVGCVSIGVKLEEIKGGSVLLDRDTFLATSSASCPKDVCILRVNNTQNNDALMMVGMLPSRGRFRLADSCFRFLVNVMLSFAFFNCQANIAKRQETSLGMCIIHRALSPTIINRSCLSPS